LQKEGVDMPAKTLRQLLDEHWGKCFGALCGLIIGLAVLFFGFLRTVFLLFCIALGIYLGHYFDRFEDLKNPFRRLWPDDK
jgi:uncharacterized membrane protein